MKYFLYQVIPLGSDKELHIKAINDTGIDAVLYSADGEITEYDDVSEATINSIVNSYQDDVFIDEIGGHHDGCFGYAPDGTYCGECQKVSCVDCKVWKSKGA